MLFGPVRGISACRFALLNKQEGGTPGEGSPLDPLLRFIKHKEVPRLSGARPGTLSLYPATFEKVDETFRRVARGEERSF